MEPYFNVFFVFGVPYSKKDKLETGRTFLRSSSSYNGLYTYLWTPYCGHGLDPHCASVSIPYTGRYVPYTGRYSLHRSVILLHRSVFPVFRQWSVFPLFFTLCVLTVQQYIFPPLHHILLQSFYHLLSVY